MSNVASYHSKKFQDFHSSQVTTKRLYFSFLWEQADFLKKFEASFNLEYFRFSSEDHDLKIFLVLILSKGWRYWGGLRKIECGTVLVFNGVLWNMTCVKCFAFGQHLHGSTNVFEDAADATDEHQFEKIFRFAFNSNFNKYSAIVDHFLLDRLSVFHFREQIRDRVPNPLNE